MSHAKKFPMSMIKYDPHCTRTSLSASRHAATAGGCVLAAMLALNPLCATADAAAPSGSAPSESIYNAPPRQGFGIKLGFNSGYKKAMLAYEPRPLWRSEE